MLHCSACEGEAILKLVALGWSEDVIGRGCWVGKSGAGSNLVSPVRLVPADSRLCVCLCVCVCLSVRLSVCTSACRKVSSRVSMGNMQSRMGQRGLVVSGGQMICAIGKQETLVPQGSYWSQTACLPHYP